MIPRTTALKREMEKVSNIICRYTQHNELLKNYRKNKTTPKGLHLKFHLASCTNNQQLHTQIQKILQRTSFTLQNTIITANSKHIKDHETQFEKLCLQLQELVNVNEYNQIMNSLKTLCR